MDIDKFINELVLDKTKLINGANKIKGKYLREIFTKEILEDFLITQEFPANYICLKFESKIKLWPGMIIKIAKEYGIKTKDIATQNGLKDVLKRREETLFKKYGVKSPLCKESPFYQKRNETVKRKYGVDNVFQNEEIKHKSKETMIRKYGVENCIFLDTTILNNGRRSFWHIQIEKFLEEYNIDFNSEYGTKGRPFKKFNTFLQREYSPIVDIFIKSHNLIIEIYGEKWHAHPDKYKDDDWIDGWKGKIQAKYIREFDKSRKEQLESFGLKVIELWCGDIKKNFNATKQQLLKELNIPEKT